MQNKAVTCQKNCSANRTGFFRMRQLQNRINRGAVIGVCNKAANDKFVAKKKLQREGLLKQF